ncbi:MAG: Uma2 family endonuclease [Planctomycetaceae bacterium]|nr:Uma2 family endonuclease [Planctomycetaceae bacterium]
MSIAEIPRKMTAEEFLALPDDGVERWLIRGELRENAESDMNRRNPDHSRTMFNVSRIIGSWLAKQTGARGTAYTGDVSFKLRRDSVSLVGIDVAYVSPELRATTPKGSKVVDGVPILAVEILSPSDTHSDVTEKVQEYLDVGVALVWVIDPDFETVGVYRPDAEPAFFNKQQELTGEPHLPGFRARVADLFE